MEDDVTPFIYQFPRKYLEVKATDKYNDNTTVPNFPEYKKPQISLRYGQF